jgi:hypothetical protein
MSLEDFLLAYRRFVARRGLPSVTFSDNAKTFIAAKFQLKEVYGHLAPKWKFIVPRSPWHGGWWERLVRSVKSGLKKSVGKSSLTRVELETDLLEIEACVNSRPLTFTGDTLESPNPLTPSHFIIGRSSHLSADEIRVTAKDLHGRKTLQELRLRQFWEVWTQEYLRSLPHVVLKVGSVVLVREDNLRRFQWPLAVVTQVYPGSDGVIRSVSLRTAKDVLNRAVQRLHSLELCDAGDELYGAAGGICEPIASVEASDSANPLNVSVGHTRETTASQEDPPLADSPLRVMRAGRTAPYAHL